MSDVHESILEMASTRVGRTLRGKWHLDSVIGVGGMAAVYAATHRNGNRVAVKMLHPQLGVDAGIRLRFLREGNGANAVKHPGVVRVLDEDEGDDGAAFLVMELLEGECIAARAEKAGGALPLPEVIAIAEQVLDTLGAAHEAGVVHRDIKPDNVFLTRDKQVKILDFGVARVRDAAGSSSTATKTGSVLGTPAFMAPEQALGRTQQVDELSDQWAVGAMMFSLLSGRWVHDGETPNEQLIAAAMNRAPALASVAPHVPAEICAVVDRALCYEKGGRWASTRAMQQALLDAAAYLRRPHTPIPMEAPAVQGQALSTQQPSASYPTFASALPTPTPLESAGRIAHAATVSTSSSSGMRAPVLTPSHGSLDAAVLAAPKKTPSVVLAVVFGGLLAALTVVGFVVLMLRASATRTQRSDAAPLGSAALATSASQAASATEHPASLFEAGAAPSASMSSRIADTTAPDAAGPSSDDAGSANAGDAGGRPGKPLNQGLPGKPNKPNKPGGWLDRRN